MTIIGFDVSKAELVGIRINRRGQEQESVTLANTEAAISAWLKQMIGQRSHLLIAAEATSEYHLPLARTCLAADIPFRLLNPIVTKQYTRATVRKRKTDLSDAVAVARLAAQGEGYFFTERDLEPAKALIRTCYQVGRLKQTLLHLQKRAEANYAAYPAFAEVLIEPQAGLVEAVKKLECLAREQTDQKIQQLLCSIPGVGPKIALILVTEIGDITRFPSGSQLIAFAGLDPRVRQSGLTLQRNTRLTKRGSPYLRRALFIAASIAQRCDPELKSYYQKKRNEGKPYRPATVAVARKLTWRIYAVWKRSTPFTACG